MKTYSVHVPQQGDYFVDQTLDVEELGTFVTVSVRDNFEGRCYVVYVDLKYNTAYLRATADYYTYTCPIILEDTENGVRFEVSF